MDWIAEYLNHDADRRLSAVAARLRRHDAGREWDGILDLIDNLRKQAWSPEPVRVPDQYAHTIADALEHWMDHKMPLYRAQVAIEENIVKAAAVADEMMRDELQRFQMVVADLETLMEHFVGRPPMTMEEVHRSRSQHEQRPAQPFRRSQRGTFQVSAELRKSIQSGNIGDPREPGQEG